MSRSALAVFLLLPLSLFASDEIERLQRSLKSPSEQNRLEALRELAAYPAAQSTPLILTALSDANSTIRGTAAWQLYSIKDPRVVPALRPLLKDSDDRVRAAAAWSISHIGGKAVLPDILPLCRDDASGVVRFRAVWGLAFIGEKSALPVVIDALGDYNASVRERAALLALDKLADASITSRLRSQSTNSFAPTRRVVMYLYSRYGKQSATPILLAGLKDPEPLVRAEAALTLGKIRATSAVSPVSALLRDTDEHVRGAAAYALGLLGDAAARPSLRALLEDEAAFVRAIAGESLNRLGDKSVQPPEGFKASELFTYPIHSPEHEELYR